MMLDLLRDALSIVLPVTCAGCGADDRSLCAECRRVLQPHIGIQHLSDGTAVYAALAYDGVARHAILDFKENGRTDVARALAAPFATAVRVAAMAAGPGGLLVVAMPVGRRSFRQRGYDPVRLLLRRAGLGSPHEMLIGLRQRGEQKALGREARAQNLHGTMSARGEFGGARVLLVDDVVTTGATLAEAGRAIRAGGGRVVGAAVLASTPRHFPHSQTEQG